MWYNDEELGTDLRQPLRALAGQKEAAMNALKSVVVALALVVSACNSGVIPPAPSSPSAPSFPSEGVIVNSVVPESGSSLTTGSYSVSITTAPGVKVGVVGIVGDRSVFLACMTTGVYSATSFTGNPIVARTTIVLIPVSVETDCEWLRLNWKDPSLIRIEAAHWN